MRERYADYAYWQPNLVTDKNGKAKFNVDFPDNITQWQSYVIGMDSKKHSGIGYATTKAFKKISGQLSVPRFLIVGDQANLIGKALNYTTTSYPLKTEFSINGKTLS